MRVAFLGNAAWSVPSLEALAASSHPVELVLTRAPKPGGRGNRPLRTPVAEAAERLRLPLAEVETVKRGPGLDRVRRARPDVLAVVAYGEILPEEVLDLPARMPVNVHFSLLPELRGAAPVQRALLEGLVATGVTTIRMDVGMDTGPILLQQVEAIDPLDDAGSLGGRLAAVGGRLLVDTLDRMQADRLAQTEQDPAVATFAPKLRPQERRIDWSEDVEHVVNRVRALAPVPAAATTFRGRGLKIYRAAAGPSHPPDVGGSRIPPGTILDAGGPEGLRVSAGEGSVGLVEVQPEGRRRMSAAEFARGYRPERGERLG